MSVKNIAVGAAAVGISGAMLPVLGASAVPSPAVGSQPEASSAPTDCWFSGFEKPGPELQDGSQRTYPAYLCANVSGAAIYNEESWPWAADYLSTTTSWFVCKIDYGGDNGADGPHPNRWLYTQGDDEGAWGWVSDNDIYSETNPVPNC